MTRFPIPGLMPRQTGANATNPSNPKSLGCLPSLTHYGLATLSKPEYAFSAEGTTLYPSPYSSATASDPIQDRGHNTMS
ncbi:uncharacterized protein EI90DRAFT_3050393 [Cantharellus anzutake]|uniref:uncharacterized protein n=1 Tax=Cantharellus anzutake TaxID=1750568 RepID=UPI0019034423|nr:uncharacterized protein EI90DRAFT_3050393 [Cantharellus anzutake]KAF8333948.1 hypothetical protein EI90DRAFT_3050393 [Cantharellus anzutake]